jgi:hypothetical protein
VSLHIVCVFCFFCKWTGDIFCFSIYWSVQFCFVCCCCWKKKKEKILRDMLNNYLGCWSFYKMNCFVSEQAQHLNYLELPMSYMRVCKWKSFRSRVTCTTRCGVSYCLEIRVLYCIYSNINKKVLIYFNHLKHFFLQKTKFIIDLLII